VISQSNITTNIEKTLHKEVDSLFPKSEIQMIFLNNGVEKSVEAYQANSLPCSEIIEHLNRGESVFISYKPFNKEKYVNTLNRLDDILFINHV
jgi:hypothetical protein